MPKGVLKRRQLPNTHPNFSLGFMANVHFLGFRLRCNLEFYKKYSYLLVQSRRVETTMGEAKRKLEEVRVTFLQELEKWSFPISDWEIETVREITQLPSVRVTRYPTHVLAYMRMPPRQCHANARFMQDNDPDKRLKQVTGWWIQEGQYVLHSVVDQHGDYVCVTPAPMESDQPFDFIPDDKIEWRDEGEYRTAYRDGVEIGPGVRTNPVKLMEEMKIIKGRLLSGMNPYEAMRLL